MYIIVIITFLVPYCKTGRDFIDQLTKHIDDWYNRWPMQHLALKAVIALLAVALQKPGQRSKAKGHQECLEKRLALWRNGEIESLLREGRIIQRHLSKSNKNDPPNKARIFAKLVTEGQINSALWYLSENDSGGVLPLINDVVRQLKEKHPDAQRAKLGSLLFGPVEDIPDSVYQGINGELVREAALRTSRGSWNASLLRDQVSTYVSLLLHSQEDCAQNLLIHWPLSLSQPVTLFRLVKAMARFVQSAWAWWLEE